jgi:hypothetical protein
MLKRISGCALDDILRRVSIGFEGGRLVGDPGGSLSARAVSARHTAGRKHMFKKQLSKA